MFEFGPRMTLPGIWLLESPAPSACPPPFPLLGVSRIETVAPATRPFENCIFVAAVEPQGHGVRIELIAETSATGQYAVCAARRRRIDGVNLDFVTEGMEVFTDHALRQIAASSR